MPDLSFVSDLIETIYGFSPAVIEPIQRYTFDWRGIFYVRGENGQHWVLRLLNHPEAAAGFHITATLLDWLNQQRYPAPGFDERAISSWSVSRTPGRRSCSRLLKGK